MRCYFNVKDGKTMLDEEGIEFLHMDDVKTEAVRSSSDMLKGLEASIFGLANLGLLGQISQTEAAIPY